MSHVSSYNLGKSYSADILYIYTVDVVLSKFYKLSNDICTRTKIPYKKTL